MEKTTKRRRPKRIWVTNPIYGMLKEEFGCSDMTVLNALKFFTYSDLADRIRARAMELMEAVQQENRDLLKENQD